MDRFAFSVFFRDADTGGSGGGVSDVLVGVGETGVGENQGLDGSGASEEPGGVGDEPIESILGDDLIEGKGKQQGEQGKEGDGRNEEDKGAAAVTAEALNIPEGYEYDQALGDSFLSVVNDTGLSRGELAQRLLDMYVQEQGRVFESLQASERATVEFLKKQEAGYLEQSKMDAEFGGAGFEVSLNVIRAGRDRLATPGAVEVLEGLGIHNHPEIVRMFYRAGLLVSEDRSAGAGGDKVSKRSSADAIFGESLKKFN